MQRLIFPWVFLVSLTTFSQKMYDEFMPTLIGDKEAFLSSKTGEFVYRAHDKTDVTALYTTESGTVIHEDRRVHAVKKGETLSAVAKKHGITIADLKKQNKLKSNSLSIGQELKITIKNIVPSSKPVINKPEGKIIARLAPGQTPGGMTPPDLPPDAMPGSTINLVVEGDKQPQTKQETIAKTEPLSEAVPEYGIIAHTVKGGETLFSIARKYKVSISDLKKENNLALNTLSVGQKLKVKVYNAAVFKQNKQTNIGQVRDTLGRVEFETEVVAEVQEVIEAPAEKEKVIIEEHVEAEEVGVKEVKEVKEAVAEEKIEAVKKGTVISSVPKDLEKPAKNEKAAQDANEARTKALIEKYKKKEATLTSKDVEKPKTDKPSVYTVRKGDTLWSIAKRLHISIKDLKKLNKLTSDALSIGQELKVK